MIKRTEANDIRFQMWDDGMVRIDMEGDERGSYLIITKEEFVSLAAQFDKFIIENIKEFSKES